MFFFPLNFWLTILALFATGSSSGSPSVKLSNLVMSFVFGSLIWPIYAVRPSKVAASGDLRFQFNSILLCSK